MEYHQDKQLIENVNAPIIDQREKLVELIDGEPMVSSLKLAERFGKNHKDVLRSIRNLECSDEFNRRNFAPVEIEDAKGQRRPAFYLTEQGFSFLAMGFTGKEAARWKEKHILAFTEMRKMIEGGSVQPDFSDPRTMLACFDHLNSQVKQLESTVSEQNGRLKKLDRLEGADGSMCITDAAKALNKRPKDLFAFMSAARWIYKRPGNRNWLAYGDKIQQGLMEHDDHIYINSIGEERVNSRALVTAKGLVKLAELLEQSVH